MILTTPPNSYQRPLPDFYSCTWYSPSSPLIKALFPLLVWLWRSSSPPRSFWVAVLLMQSTQLGVTGEGRVTLRFLTTSVVFIIIGVVVLVTITIDIWHHTITILQQNELTKLRKCAMSMLMSMSATFLPKRHICNIKDMIYVLDQQWKW